LRALSTYSGFPHLLRRRHDGVHGIGAYILAEGEPAGQPDRLADHLESLV
jgi:hypothetical protein